MIVRRANLTAGICLAICVIACQFSCRAASAPQQWVWWEGEEPIKTNFPARTWLSPRPEEKKLLSADDWLTFSGKAGAEELYAIYRVSVPASGEYNFWARKFWKHGPFKWRFGTGEWHICGRDVALADDTYIRKFVNANWVHLGKVRLPAGETTFELRMLATPGQNVVAGFDCFLLIPGPFMPRGKLKPNERWNVADEGYFPYEPSLDKFTDDALLDLRFLNEPQAGQSGWVRRHGDGFVLGGGRPVRFWAVNVGPNNIAQDRASIDYLARALAKRGVNMVRYHGPIFDPNSPSAEVDSKRLDDLHYLIAALKRQGIYTLVSFYFPLWFNIKPSYGIAGFDQIKNKRPFALLYFEPRMQQIYRTWARELLTRKNPYTGLPIARDPAVAIIEIVNEDSFFFWTFSKRNIPPVHWARLERLFGQWLAKRYGSLQAAFAAWPKAHLPSDNAAEGRAGLYEAWHMTRSGLKHGGPNKRKRVADQVRFLAELQRKFYEDTVRYFKDELGYGGLVSCSNWKVADPALLDAIERYTYTAGDVIDRHGYFGGKHKGEGARYSVRVGHTFESLAATTVPERLPLQFVQVAGYPQIISEIGWTNPNRYRADFTLLTAACGCVQGLDGAFFFAVGSNFLCDNVMKKFPVSCPTVAGAFPAAALLFRRGDVKECQAVKEVLSLEDLYALKGSAAISASALDELRKSDIPAGGAVSQLAAIDPLAFYVGRVVRSFSEEAGASEQVNLLQFINRERKTLANITGELKWDWGTGVVYVNTPRAQAAAGFLSRVGAIQLQDVVIRCGNEYASIIVTSLDDQPLSRSRKILVQAITQEQPYGFKTRGNKIASLGGPPLEMEEIKATVEFKSLDSAARVIVLDENGYATDKRVKVSRKGNGAVVTLSKDALYHVVLR